MTLQFWSIYVHVYWTYWWCSDQSVCCRLVTEHPNLFIAGYLKVHRKWFLALCCSQVSGEENTEVLRRGGHAGQQCRHVWYWSGALVLLCQLTPVGGSLADCLHPPKSCSWQVTRASWPRTWPFTSSCVFQRIYQILMGKKRRGGVSLRCRMLQFPLEVNLVGLK